MIELVAKVTFSLLLMCGVIFLGAWMVDLWAQIPLPWYHKGMMSCMMLGIMFMVGVVGYAIWS